MKKIRPKQFKFFILLSFCFINCKKNTIYKKINCKLATQKYNYSLSPIINIQFENNILKSFTIPKSKNNGLIMYLRTGQTSEEIFHDTSGVEINKHQYLYNKDGRCTTINIYKNSILHEYVNLELDIYGFSIKENYYKSSNDSLLFYFKNIYNNGNRSSVIKYNNDNLETLRFNIEYGNEKLIVENSLNTLMLGHNSNKNFRTKLIHIENEQIISTSNYKNFFNNNGLLTHWIQDGVNRADYTYNCN